MEESMNEVANLSAVSSGPLLRSNLTLHQGTYVLDKDSSFGMKGKLYKLFKNTCLVDISPILVLF